MPRTTAEKKDRNMLIQQKTRKAPADAAKKPTNGNKAEAAGAGGPGVGTQQDQKEPATATAEKQNAPTTEQKEKIERHRDANSAPWNQNV